MPSRPDLLRSALTAAAVLAAAELARTIDRRPDGPVWERVYWRLRLPLRHALWLAKEWR